MKNKIIYLTFGVALILGALFLLFNDNLVKNTSTGILVNTLMIVSGVWLLVKGADWFVDSSSSIAKAMKISALIIGLTVVSFGTSAPELAVSTAASIKAHIHHTTADIALGNVVGSNIANLLLVLGFSVAITPIIFKRGILRKEFPFLILTQLILAFFAFDSFLANGKLTGGATNIISRGEALVLILLIILFVYILVYGVKYPSAEEAIDIEKEKALAEESMSEKKPVWNIILFFIVGLVGIVLGGVLISNGAEYLAIKFATSAGANESNAKVLVGLTVVAVGTSLPELVTSIIAAKKGENEIALGNVIGSNIFNTLMILGLAGVITPLGINKNILIDIIIMIAITLFVFVISFVSKTTKDEKTYGLLKKTHGIIFLCLYVIYLTYIVLRTIA